MEERYLTIPAISKYLEYKFNIDNNLKDILVIAEISTLSISGGHYYLTIKDGDYKMQAKMFRNRAYYLNFTPKVGDKVVMEGSINIYAQGGNYSLLIDKMVLSGSGAYKLELEKLKKELGAKGYFNVDRKRAIPKYPKCVAVITSATGAVVRDVSQTIKRRYSNIKLLIYPTLVQGKFAAKNIASQIIKANKDNLADVLIIGRGGGAVEELACFNERVVCDAVYGSKIPVISAVGHERDDTLSDLIADLRVSTPTAAGEKVCEEYIKVLDNLNYNINLLNKNILNKLNNYNNILNRHFTVLKLCDPNIVVKNYNTTLNRLSNSLNKNINDIINFKKDLTFNLIEDLNYNINNNINLNKQLIDYKLVKVCNNNPLNKIDNYNLMINNLIDTFNSNILNIIKDNNHKYNYLIGKLSSINPAKLLDKGYTMTKINDRFISSIKDVNTNDLVEVSLKDGKFKAIVKEIENGEY